MEREDEAAARPAGPVADGHATPNAWDGRTPFVPRPEMAELVRVVQRAGAGHGSLWLLAGEAGVGKTRLCEEVTASSGLAVLRGAAVERGTAPYGPLVLALRDHLRRDPDALADAGPLSPHLGAVLPELGPPPDNSDRESLLAAVIDALRSICQRQPVVLILDDLHWADAAILELLPSIARAAREWPLAVICVYRSDELPRGHPLRRFRTELRRDGLLAELTLGTVDATATARIAAGVLGLDLGPMARAAVFDRTLGVPFFIEELATALWASGRLVLIGDEVELESGAELPIPATIRDAIRVRADSMSDPARASLQAASVIGSAVDLDLLTALGEDAGIDEVIECGLLVEPELGSAAFRHDLVRDAVHADTPWPRRRALHRRLADILESRGSGPRLVADHLLAAGERDRALPLLLDAARNFASVHAARDAAAAIRTALEVWPEGADPSGRIRALDELARCAQRCGELADAAAAWEEASVGLDPLADPRLLAEVRRDLAAVYELLGSTERSAAARIEAAELFMSCGAVVEAAGARLLAAQQVHQARPQEAMALIDAVLESVRTAGRWDLEARAQALQGLVLGMGGHLDKGTEAARAGLALAIAHHDVEAAVRAHWVLGTIANHWADYESAESAFGAAVVLCRTEDIGAAEHLCLSCIALVAYNRGQWTRAEELARGVLQSAPRSDAEVHALLVLGLVNAGRGATKRARSLLDRSLVTARRRNLGSTVFQANAALALVDELEGSPSLRWRELLDTPPTALRMSYGWWLSRAATIAARRGDLAQVYRCADVLPAWVSQFGGVEATAALAHVLGEVLLAEGDPHGAADSFGRALALLSDIDAPHEVAHTRMRAGVALAAAGEREAGVGLLVGAYRTFRQLGARPFWMQASADLELLGERVDQRLDRRAAHALAHGGLTRRELEILRLVAVGRTNREIAADLFVSPRTVDMHVRNMLTKLGCRSRTEATSRAHELGLLTIVE